RQATFGSGQGASNVAKQVSMAVDAHTRKWINLPRAAQSTSQIRSEIRLKFRDSQACYLLTDAAVTLAVGSSFKAMAKLLRVFSLDRRYMTKLYTLKLMGLGLMFRLGFSRGRIALENYV